MIKCYLSSSNTTRGTMGEEMVMSVYEHAKRTTKESINKILE